MHEAFKDFVCPKWDAIPDEDMPRVLAELHGLSLEEGRRLWQTNLRDAVAHLIVPENPNTIH